MTTRIIYAVVLLSSALLSGCLPIVFATPPMRVGVSAGPNYTSGYERTEDDPPKEPSVPSGLNGHLSIEAAFTPLQLWGEEDRLLDLGLGYGYKQRWGPLPNTHGPFVEIGGLMRSPQLIGRHGLKLQSRALIGASDDQFSGFGASVSWIWEGIGWTNGDEFGECDTGGCYGGLAYGEGGVGLEVSLGVDRVRRATDFSLSVGFIFRIPASIGAGFVWLL